MGRLQDKVVVVTGGTKGIGRGIATMAASEGAKIVINGRNEAEGAAIAREIMAEYGTEALFVRGDVSSVETCKQLIDTTLKTFGRIDGLVNNAGIFPWRTMLETDEELYDQVFNVNAKSAFFCSKYAIEAMKASGGGSIVHMGSTHGYGGMEELAAYACSKGAMLTLSKHIAANYARHGIRSNWVTVGWVATEGEVARVSGEGQGTEDLERLGREQVPLGRLQTVEDMAYGVIYLLADESAQVTGTELQISGGFNI